MRGGDFRSDAGAALKPATKETLKFVAANAPELARFAVTAAGHPEYGDAAAFGAEATVPLWEDKIEGIGYKKRRGRP